MGLIWLMVASGSAAVAGLGDVAGLQAGDADAPVDRRADRVVAELDLEVLERGLVRRICAVIVCTAVRLSSSFWREAYSLAASARCGSRRAGPARAGRGTARGSLPPGGSGLDAAAVELEQDVALLDVASRPRRARPGSGFRRGAHRDGGDRLHVADRVEAHRHRLAHHFPPSQPVRQGGLRLLHRDDRHRRRWRVTVPLLRALQLPGHPSLEVAPKADLRHGYVAWASFREHKRSSSRRRRQSRPRPARQ